MINCKMCQKEISPNAKFCPHCGEPLKKKEIKLPSFYKSKKMIVLSIVLIILLSGIITLRIMLNNEIKCIKFAKKLKKEYGYECSNNAFIIMAEQTTYKFGIYDKAKQVISCERKKDNQSVDIYINEEAIDDKDKIFVNFYSDIGKDNYFHLSSNNYINNAKTKDDLTDGSKEFPPHSLGTGKYACFYFTGSNLKVGKKLNFDFDFVNENIYNLNDEEYARELKSYCEDELSEANKLKKEFEDYLDGTGIKLGE